MITTDMTTRRYHGDACILIFASLPPFLAVFISSQTVNAWGLRYYLDTEVF